MLATLQPRRKRAVLKLSPDEQAVLGQVQPKVFRRTLGGEHGWTSIELQGVDPWLFEELLVGAWRRLASRRAIARWRADRHR
jgi:SH3-like domain-containing protein